MKEEGRQRTSQENGKKIEQKEKDQMFCLCLRQETAIPKYPRKAILAVLLTQPKPSASGNLSRNSV